MTEDKKGFIDDLNLLLISRGDGRYNHLIEYPLQYVRVTNPANPSVYGEYVSQGANMVNITGDSLTAILEDLHKAKVI